MIVSDRSHMCSASNRLRASRLRPAGRLGIAVLFLGAALAHASDWPQFLGPNANGRSAERGINKDWTKRPPKALWKAPLTDGGYTGPAVAGGLVFIIDHAGSHDVVKALDLNTGQERWRYEYEETSQDVFGFARSTPTIRAGKVYTMSRLGLVHCLDSKTGSLVWSRNVVADFKGTRPKWDVSSSPVVDGRKVLVCPGGDNAAVVALDKDMGKTIWQGGGSGVTGYSTPVVATIHGKRQYVMYLFTLVEGIDADNGRVLWTFPWSDWSGVSACAPVLVGDAVFVTSGYARGCALLDVADAQPKPRWDNKALESEFSSPVLIDGFLYCTSASGVLVCVDVASGKRMWQQPGFEKGGLIGVDGTLIVMNGSNGDITMVAASPAGFKELGRMQGLGGQSWTAPILANGKLIVRNKRTLACFELH